MNSGTMDFGNNFDVGRDMEALQEALGRTLQTILANDDTPLPHAMAGLNRLALCGFRCKSWEDTRLLLNASLHCMKRMADQEHVESRLAFSLLANIELECGERDLAAQYAAKAEQGFNLAEEKDKCSAMEVMINLADYNFLCQRFEPAEKLYRKVLVQLNQAFGQGHPSFACCKEKAELFCQNLGQAGQTALQNRLALVLKKYQR